MRRWTITDVAREAGVSKTTVSRVLNRRPDVDADTSARVLRVVDGLGYVQSSRGVQLAKGRTNSIALIAMADPAPWMLQVLKGALEQVEQTEFSITIHAYPVSPAAMDRFNRQVGGGSMDALLVVSPPDGLDAIDRAQSDGLPVLLIQAHGTHAGVPAVEPDEAVGIAAAVDHLVAVGRRRFAVLVGPAEYHVSHERLKAYRTAVASHGLELDERQIVVAPFSEAGGRQATLELIEKDLPFDALVASSDAMAVGAMRALKHRGRAIPDDVSVVGFDDFPSAEFTEPRLTTVHNPLYEMSSRAVKRLIQAVQTGQPLDPGPEVVRTFLIVRESSDPSLKQS